MCSGAGLSCVLVGIVVPIAQLESFFIVYYKDFLKISAMLENSDYTV